MTAQQQPDAILTALRHTWFTLKPLGIPVALMGGIALATWKYVRATRDIDLLLGTADESPDHLMEVLKASGFRVKHSPPIIQLGRLDLLQLVYEPPETFADLQIDLLLARSEYHRKALERRLPVRLPGLDFEIEVLACEDLILHKLLAGRIIDLADTAALLAANHDTLDCAYLMKWIESLDLGPVFRQTWHAAWPNEPVPGRAGD